MKRTLIITLVLALLISTVCSTAAVSAAAPGQNPTIYMYTTPDLTTAHASPNGILRPFAGYRTYTFSPSASPPQFQQSAVGSRLSTSLTAVGVDGQWGGNVAELQPRFYVENWENAQEKSVTITVKLTYTLSGRITTDPENELAVFYHTVTVTLANGYTKEVATFGSFMPGTYSETKTITVPITAQLADLSYGGNDLGLTVQLQSSAGASGIASAAQAAGTVTVSQIQLQWAD